jgi:hypothetical protein
MTDRGHLTEPGALLFDARPVTAEITVGFVLTTAPQDGHPHPEYTSLRRDGLGRAAVVALGQVCR